MISMDEKEIYGFPYSGSRYNEDEDEMEYFVDGEWQLESDLAEDAQEQSYWLNDYAQEIEDQGNW